MPYNINGQSTSLGEEPHVKNGATYVPFRETVEALGGKVTWDNASKTASATIGQWTAKFTVGDGTADVNGTSVQFPAASYVENGTLYVPAQFFHNAYGYNVQATGENVTISL